MQVFKAFLKVLKSRIGIAAVYIVIFLAVGFFISRLDNGTEVWQQTKMNLMIVDRDGSVYIYYASSDTRLHVAATDMDRLVDYVFNTPEDPLRSVDCVKQRIGFIRKNLQFLNR